VTARPITASYRVQFEPNFTFDDACRLVPYLARLGVSHLYSSPVLAARKSSTHGYDVVDPGRLNPELGSPDSFDTLVDTLKTHGMGLILDIVPNHMAAGEGNPWWYDLLEWGWFSAYALFFDIDWRPQPPDSEGKLLLPVLAEPFGSALVSGAFVLAFEAEWGVFVVRHETARFPISPFDYSDILQPILIGEIEAAPALRRLVAAIDRSLPKEESRSAADMLKARLAEWAGADPTGAAALHAAAARFTGTEGRPESWNPLGVLLDRQAYRLAWWRVASEEINYRRFFDISDLAGLRVERSEVFDASHRMILSFVEDDKVQGLRIDHIDGLADPLAYIDRLRSRIGAERYIYVEKILAPDEPLPINWAVEGTTGYDALNQLTRLFADPAGETPLSELYDRIQGEHTTFPEVRTESKRSVLRSTLASELQRLVRDIRLVAARSWDTRDFTYAALRDALEALLIELPVYRTYITLELTTAVDREILAASVARARAGASNLPAGAFTFLERILAGEDGEPMIVRRFQQLSGPAMAKGLEDTAFYRYLRLVSHNEVGGDPGRFATSLGGFHGLCRERAVAWPQAMLAGSTHDTKRGEDARARILCLSGCAAAWSDRIKAWQEINRRHLRVWNDMQAPVPKHEYYLYQSLIGAWPADLTAEDTPGIAALEARLLGGLIKAVREGKEYSNWTVPDEAYEHCCEQFLSAILRDPAFLHDFLPFARTIAWRGALTSLSQTLIRFTMPGVPDIYRGSEGWDLSLVDPDNRRPVDYEPLRGMLDQLAPDASIVPWLDHWPDGGVKLALIARVLSARQRWPQLFTQGTYTALEPSGSEADRIVAFRRQHERVGAITIAPRFWRETEGSVFDSGDSQLELPSGPYRNILTGERYQGGTKIDIASLLAGFPVALLIDSA
jgi:(1->4)-alpha-D-glucan 1-alpha-D-glucosylmutase